MKITRRTYSAEQVAQLLGVNASTIRRQARAGKLKHLKPIFIGQRIVFPQTLIDDMTGAAA